jgi:rod shape determining protein RodA
VKEPQRTAMMQTRRPNATGSRRQFGRDRGGATLLDRLYRQVVPQLIATRVAWLMLLAIVFLCAASLAAVNICGPTLLEHQQIYMLVGAAILLLALIPSFWHIGNYANIFYIITTILLAGVLFAPAIKGSHRWFELPGPADVEFQPSELAKISFVMIVAWHLRTHRDIRRLSSLLFPFVLMIIPMALILVESDLGTALLFPLVLYAMLIAAGARLRHLIAILLIVAAVAPGCYPLLKDYQKQRVIALLVHDQSSKQQLTGDEYQIQQSKIAEGSGGLFGQGLEGTDEIRHGLLPEASNDFIFSVVGSQWGFVGCTVILLLYAAFFGACLEIAGETTDCFGRLLVVGLSSMMIGQVVINIAMTTGLIPVVGITLPFMSYGGSAMAADMLATSLILNVAMRRHSRQSVQKTGLPV